MDWTRSLSVGADDALEPAAVGEKKDATRAAKRVRRREQQKVAQQRYRCAALRISPLCGRSPPWYIMVHTSPMHRHCLKHGAELFEHVGDRARSWWKACVEHADGPS